jgi:cytochrome c oxidase subunit 1
MQPAIPQPGVPQPSASIPGERKNYLNEEYGIWSWLLTTDHKRIALLYLLSITFFFFIGGFFALLIRLELLTPAGDLVQADTYNKLFTMHGMVMVFFFLIPSIPAVLGNFLVPLMIGAKDLAFPRINLLSWYLYIIGGALMMHCMLTLAGRFTLPSAPNSPTQILSKPELPSSSPDFPPSSPG